MILKENQMNRRVATISRIKQQEHMFRYLKYSTLLLLLLLCRAQFCLLNNAPCKYTRKFLQVLSARRQVAPFLLLVFCFIHSMGVGGFIDPTSVLESIGGETLSNPSFKGSLEEDRILILKNPVTPPNLGDFVFFMSWMGHTLFFFFFLGGRGGGFFSFC